MKDLHDIVNSYDLEIFNEKQLLEEWPWIFSDK